MTFSGANSMKKLGVLINPLQIAPTMILYNYLSKCITMYILFNLEKLN